MPLIGKYFIGVHDDCIRSGIVEAAGTPRATLNYHTPFQQRSEG